MYKEWEAALEESKRTICMAITVHVHSWQWDLNTCNPGNLNAKQVIRL